MASKMKYFETVIFGLLMCTYGALSCRGPVGKEGLPGPSCTTYEVSTGAVIICGETVSHVYNGRPGENGTAATCSTQQLSNGSETICSDGSHSVVVNGSAGVKGDTGASGSNGTNGHDSPITPYSITDVLLPCGAGGGYDEVLLRLGDGQLLAHFTEGSREFLSILKPGNYVTASIPACYFSIDAGNNLFNTHR